MYTCVFSSVHTRTCMYVQCTCSDRDWELVLYFLCESRGLNLGHQPGRKYLFTHHTFTPAPQPHFAKLHLELTDLGRPVGQQASGSLLSPLRAGTMNTCYNTGLLNVGSADQTHILYVQGKHFTNRAVPSLSPAFHLLHVSSSFTVYRGCPSFNRNAFAEGEHLLRPQYNPRMTQEFKTFPHNK